MSIDVFDKKTATVEEVLNEVSKIRTVVTEAVEDGVKSAFKAVKNGREAAEDAIDDAKRAVKKNPLQAIGITFSIGVVVGCLLALAGRHRD